MTCAIYIRVSTDNSLMGGLGVFEQHLKNANGHGCPAKRYYGRVSIFAEAKQFLAGELRAVLRENTQDRTH